MTRLTSGLAVAGSTIASRVPLGLGDPLAWAGEPAQLAASVDETGVRSLGGHALHREHRSPDGGAPEPAPVLTTPSGSGAGSFAIGGSGLLFFGVAGVLAWFALGVPRLMFRLRLVKELGTPAPFVLLLDRPG